MRTFSVLLALAGMTGLAAPAAAQQEARTISAGMSADDVRAAFGAPAVVRHADGWTYFFYTNRCLPRCGTDDTVFLYDDRVVAAVLHSPARRFAGPGAAAALGAVPAARTGASVSGIRVRTIEAAPAADLGVIRGRPAPPAPAEEPRPDEEPGTVVRVDTIMLPPEPQPQAEQQPRTPAPQAEPPAREGRIQPNTIRRPRP